MPFYFNSYYWTVRTIGIFKISPDHFLFIAFSPCVIFKHSKRHFTLYENINLS